MMKKQGKVRKKKQEPKSLILYRERGRFYSKIRA